MNYAAVLKPKKATVPAEEARYLKKGWVNLRDYDYESSKPKRAPEEDMDAKLKEAAVALRRRWDRWNEEHGIDYDYDRECSCSDVSSDTEDSDDENGAAADEDGDFDRDYQYIKKTTLITH